MNRNYVAIIIGVISLGLFIFAAIFITPQTDYRHARISEEKYSEIIANRKESSKSLLQNLKFNDHKVYYAKKNNTWYYSIIENDQNAKNPRIKTYGDGPLNISFKDSQDINQETIANATPLVFIAYNDDYYYEYKLAITTLPIIQIEHEDEILKESDVNISFELFDNREKTIKRTTKTAGKIHIRGASTAIADKKSYRINLRYKSPGEHDRNANEPLLGMREDDDWILYSASIDDDKLRNNLCEKLWYSASQDNPNLEQATGVEAKWTEVIDNDEYKGLYALTTTIDEKTLGIKKNSYGNYSNYIIKKNYPWKEIIIDGIDNKEKYPDIEHAQYELKTSKIADKEEAENKIRTYLYKTFILKDVNYIKENTEIISLIDMSLFANMTMDYDKFAAENDETGDYKNTYLANLETNNGEKFVYIPWDFDATWGISWDYKPYHAPPNSQISDKSFISSTLRDNDSAYKQKETERYARLRNKQWSNEKLEQIINEQEKDIFKSGAYNRDYAAWHKKTDAENKNKNNNLDIFKTYAFKRLEYMDYWYGLREDEPEPLDENWLNSVAE
ncbi:CotH kinase family protein [Candidatus Saccharibacteria bacterium]|nr:CotH kinase family protein [Candidatus Saccharibacteria bacterium]